MDSALDALERNHKDATETLRKLIQHPDARYDVVRSTINPIAMATHKHQVLSQPARLNKYVRVISYIAETQHHLEHMNCDEWTVLIKFLLVAHYHFGELLTAVEYIKACQELFRSLSLLVSCSENCNSDIFGEIIDACTKFIDFTGRKESSSHGYIMKCCRVLTKLGDENAVQLGNRVANLGQARNPFFIEEIYLFACMVPQPLNILLELGPEPIYSHEVEFVPSPEFGMRFRPSAAADLKKFVAAKALGVAVLESSSTVSTQEPATKRFKREYSDHAVRTMRAAFTGGYQESYEQALPLLFALDRERSSSVSISSNGGSSAFSGSFTTSHRTTNDMRQDSALLWEFVVLAQSIGIMTKSEMLVAWNLCIEYIRRSEASSGACYCLASLVSRLVQPEFIDAIVMEKFTALLGSMGSSSHPELSSGSLFLYSRLHAIKVLDTAFQNMKRNQLKEWFQSRIRDSPPCLVMHLFSDTCRPAYLQTELAQQLEGMTSFSQAKAIITVTEHDEDAGGASGACTLHYLFEQFANGGSKAVASSSSCYPPLITNVSQINVATVKDSLWALAILASCRQNPPPCPKTTADAFDNDDLKALVWFASLASHFDWDEQYCRYALALAPWTTAASSFESVEIAVSILKKPSPVANSLLSGDFTSALQPSKDYGSSLRSIEPFLQSYAFQRSQWFLARLVQLLGLHKYLDTKEGMQLVGFLIRVASSQSQFSKLRYQLGTIGIWKVEGCLAVVEECHYQLKLELLANTGSKLAELIHLPDFADKLIDSFPEELKIVAGTTLHFRKAISLSKLFVILSENGVNGEKFRHICVLLQLGADIDRIFSISALPLYYSGLGNEYQDVLSDLGAPTDLFNRYNTLLRLVENIDFDRSDELIAAVIDQSIKECCYAGSDLERLNCIKRMYTFMTSHRSKVSEALISVFFESAIGALSLSSSGNWPLTSSYITSLAKDVLRTRDPLTIANLAVCFSNAGFHETSEKLYTWISTSTLPFCKLLTSASRVRIDELPLILENAVGMNLNCEFETWSTLLNLFQSAVERAGVEVSLEKCKSIPVSLVNSLIFWTNYIEMSESVTWTEFTSRLIIMSGEIDAEEINMLESVYMGSLLDPAKPETFLSCLVRVSARLPYSKKWKLHPFLQRIKVLAPKLPMSDIYGPENWELEVQYRPYNRGESNGAPAGMSTNVVSEIGEIALKILKLPSLGLHVYQEIPELAKEFLPNLVAAAYAECSSAARSNSSLETGLTSESSQVRSLTSDLDVKIRMCLQDDDRHRELGLSILRQCYQTSKTIPVAYVEAARACQSLCHSNKRADFIYMGIMMIELIWNEDPERGLLTEQTEILRNFYNLVSESAYKSALPSNSFGKNLVSSVLSDEKVTTWQKLQVSLINGEVQAETNNSSFPAKEISSSLQGAGLWNMANRLADENYYDLEKAWWLRQWDTFQFYDSMAHSNQGAIFQNIEYGTLISFFNNRMSEARTLCELSKQSMHMASIFDKIVRPAQDHEFIGDPVFQLGRAVLLGKNNDVFELVNLYKQLCEFYREEGDLSRALSCTMKLEKLANAAQKDTALGISNKDDLNLGLISRIEVAKMEWSLGRNSEAIATLKELALSVQPSGKAQQSENLEELAGIYSTLGTWSRAARNESDSSILDTYFLKACELVTDKDRGRVYHEFARFCDVACHDETLKTAIEDSERVKASEKKKVEYLTKAIQNGNSDKAFQNKYRVSLRMLRSENEDCEELKHRKMSLTLRCIENYILSLTYDDNYEEDMDRLVAIWMECMDNREVNTKLLMSVDTSKTSGSHLPSRKFLTWANQLSSRLGKENEAGFQRALRHILLKMVTNYPHHSLWQIINSVRSRTVDRTSTERKAAAKGIIEEASRNLGPLVKSMLEFADKMTSLGREKPLAESNTMPMRALGSSVSQWWCVKLPRLKIPVPTATIPLDGSKSPVIFAVDPEVQIAGGISAPKIVTMTDSNGTMHKMVLKGSDKDDLRQDAIMEQVFGMAQRLISRDRSANKRGSSSSNRGSGGSSGARRGAAKIRVRTYNVIPLGGISGAIEFVKNTCSLLEVLEPLHTAYGGRREYGVKKARHLMHSKRDGNRTVRLSVYEDVMAHTRPQMRRFWTKKFKDPLEWFQAKTAWSRSTAVMSILGYIVGLGDRHCSNLLVDVKSGEVVHIDLGIAFDQGKQLYIPETVPFRLTRDMVDGMGVPGTNGVFTRAAELTLEVMRNQREQVMNILEVLKYDTLYTWRLPPLRLNRIQAGVENQLEVPEASIAESGQAEHALRGVRQKLSDNLSCEAMVRDLTAQARDPGNLALIFSGWSPFY